VPLDFSRLVVPDFSKSFVDFSRGVVSDGVVISSDPDVFERIKECRNTYEIRRLASRDNEGGLKGDDEHLPLKP
jgi:hypothetical protein